MHFDCFKNKHIIDTLNYDMIFKFRVKPDINKQL